MAYPVFFARDRRNVRRAVRTRCQAVALDAFRLVGERVIDLSEGGMLLACDGGVRVGDSMIVSFQAPHLASWFDAEAEVARVIGGYRPEDRGYCAGLRFTRLDGRAERLLRIALRGLPPPVPARALRKDYARIVRLASRETVGQAA